MLISAMATTKLCILMGFMNLQTPQEITQPELSSKNMPQQSVTATDAIVIPEGVTTLSEKTLLLNPMVYAKDMPQANSSRIYAFALEPKEEINLSLTTSDMTAIGCTLLEPAKPGPLTPAFFRLNRMPPSYRLKSMKFKNTTSSTFVLRYMVYGLAYQPYSISIERTPENPPSAR